MLLIVAVAGWLGWICHRARVQREAVAAIEAAGGTVNYDWEWTWESRHVGGSPGWLRRQLGPGFFEKARMVAMHKADDAVMTHIGRLPHLQVLMDWDSRVTDKGLAEIRGLQDLRWLEVNSAGVTERSLAIVGECTRLESLQLNLKIHDLNLSFLRRLPSLEELHLRDRKAVACDLSPIGSLTRLKDLGLGMDIDDGQVTALMASLAAPSQLEILDLGHTRITDRALPTIVPLANLRELYLNNTAITDAGLGDLAALKHCQRLGIGRTNVTSDGIVALKAKCPWIEIIR
jgi:hypothetical protein